MRLFRGLSVIALTLLLVPALTPIPVAADTAKLLLTDEEASLARLAVGNHVEKEVNYSTYEFDQGRTGMLVLARLCQIAREGKTTRLLLDGWAHRVDRATLAYLIADCGVQVRIYHPLDRPLSTVTRRPIAWKTQRMHDKLLIRDGVEAIGGSRNTRDRYFTFRGQPAQGQPRSSDIDLYVRGASVADANRYFLSLFESGEALPPAQLDKVSPGQRARAGARIEHFSEVLRRWNARPSMHERIESALEGATPVKNARFFHNVSSPSGNRAGVVDAQLGVLRDARSGDRVLVETPYLIMTPRLERAIRAAIDRGATIDFLTNDENEGEDWLTSVNYKNERDQVIDLGRTRRGRMLRIWDKLPLSSEHDPAGARLRRTAIHGKAATNGRMIAVTSANWDPRSMEGKNLEVGWQFESPELSRELAERRILPLISSRQVKQANRNTPSIATACRNALIGVLTSNPWVRSQL